MARQAGMPVVLHSLADWGVPSERFVVELLRSMHRSTPVVACGIRHPTSSPEPMDIPVTALQPLASRAPNRYRHRVLRGLLAAVALRRRAAVLHAHFGYWAAHTAAVAGKLQRPWVLSLHGHDVLVQWEHELEPDRVRTADVVIVPSRFLADVAVQRGFPADRIRVIPSGLDPDHYTFRLREPRTDRSVRVTFIGRFVAKKGVLDAARAMAAAAANYPGFSFRFVGYGPMEADLRAELTRLRLAAEIVDGRTHAALRRCLDETDLVLTPSRTGADGDAESLGLVNLEAQLSGAPVVTTRHGGIPESVSPDGAVLVPEGDVDGLAKALVALADAPQRWAQMGRAGRDHVRAHFDLRTRAAEVEQCYVELLQRVVD